MMIRNFVDGAASDVVLFCILMLHIMYFDCHVDYRTTTFPNGSWRMTENI